jgi:hypothetical protein
MSENHLLDLPITKSLKNMVALTIAEYSIAQDDGSAIIRQNNMNSDVPADTGLSGDSGLSRQIFQEYEAIGKFLSSMGFILPLCRVCVMSKSEKNAYTLFWNIHVDCGLKNYYGVKRANIEVKNVREFHDTNKITARELIMRYHTLNYVIMKNKAAFTISDRDNCHKFRDICIICHNSMTSKKHCSKCSIDICYYCYQGYGCIYCNT